MRSYPDPGGEIYTRRTGDAIPSKTPGQIAYEAYAEVIDADYYLYETAWSRLSLRHRNAWEAAAQKIQDTLLKKLEQIL